MKLQRSLEALKKNWLLVVAAGAIGLACAGIYNVTATPRYQATSSVFFSLQGGDGSQLLQGSTFARNQVTSFEVLATKPVVLQPVIDELGLNTTPEALAGSITASVPVDTSVLDVTATRTDAVEVAEIANSVSTQLAVEVEKLYTRDGESDVSVKATQVAEAQVPGQPAFPRTNRNLVAGLLLGLVLGAGAIVLREFLTNRVRDEETVAALTAVPVIGAIEFDSRYDDEPVVGSQTEDGRSEGFRRLRTNLEFLNFDRTIKAIAISAGLPKEGKSTTSINLAAALADSQRVIVIDADLRRPLISERLGLAGSVGLATVLAGQATLDTAIQTWGRNRMDVLTTGDLPPNPAQLLGSNAMRDLLQELRQRYDVVIIDSAPVLPVSDTLGMARFVDAVLLVVDCRKTTRTELSSSLAEFERAGATPQGIVLNRTEPLTKADYSGYRAQ